MSDPTNPQNPAPQGSQGCVKSNAPQHSGNEPRPGASPANCPDVNAMRADAQNLGLDAGLFTQLLTTFGPMIAQALLNLFKKKQEMQQQAAARAHPQGQPAHAATNTAGQPATAGNAAQPQQWGLDFSMVTNLLVILLIQHRDDILSSLSQAEAQLLDAIIAKLQGQTPNLV